MFNNKINKNFTERAGFTLIELSIVLVIIGLLVGAILLGQDLIKGFQARKLIADAERYETAYNAFRSKYNCLPGDCTNATAYFGNTTNNGNGDGLHYHYNGGEPGEAFLPWEQLSLAGLIDGVYTHTPGPGGGVDAVLGSNTPPVKGFSGAGWMIWSYQSDGSSSDFVYPMQNMLMAGGKTANNLFNSYIFDVYTVQKVDQKIDDDMPGLGKVRGYISCSTTTDPKTAQYDTTKLNIICSTLVILWGTP